MFFKAFKPINELTRKLNYIIKNNVTKPLSVFLMGKNVDIYGSKYEILGYFMNDKINWDAITSEGKTQIIQALKDSGLFNLQHQFWKKRLT